MTRNPVYQSSDELPYKYEDPDQDTSAKPHQYEYVDQQQKPVYLLNEEELRQKLADVEFALKNQNQAGNPQLIEKRIQYKFLLGYILRKGYYGCVINEEESQQYLKAAAEEEKTLRERNDYSTAAGSLALGFFCDKSAAKEEETYYAEALLCPNAEEMEPVIHCFIGNFLYNHSELTTNHSTVTLFGRPGGTSTTKTYDQQKLTEAVAHFKKSADAGYVYAQCCLGYNGMWPQGKDISGLVSVEAAFNYLKQAATEGGCARAMSSMGNVYAVGTAPKERHGKSVVNKDLKKARHWYEEALKQNYSNAQIGLDKIRPSCCTIS